MDRTHGMCSKSNSVCDQSLQPVSAKSSSLCSFRLSDLSLTIAVALFLWLPPLFFNGLALRNGLECLVTYYFLVFPEFVLLIRSGQSV